jgi:glycosyltransferase involved in cell wall biosynthesis
LKIAVLGSRSYPAAHGGLEVVVEELSRELSRDNDVTVFVSEGHDRTQDGVHVHVSRSLRGKYSHTASQMIFGLRDVIRGDFDVVHIHGVGPAFVLLIWPFRKRKSRVFVTAHGLDWERRKWPRAAGWLFRKISVAALRRADALSAVSAPTADRLGEIVGKPVRVISNGISLPVLPLPRPGLPSKYSVVVSRLTPEKNIEAVLRAYGPDLAEVIGPLLLVGGGSASYSADYERQLRELGGPHVQWLGVLPRHQTLAVVSRATVSVSMSRTEAQPMAVIEAAALGVPLILSDIPEHRAVGLDAAVYVSPDSPQQLAEALRAVDQIDRSAVERNAREWCDRDWRAVAEDYRKWFLETTAEGAQHLQVKRMAAK